MLLKSYDYDVVQMLNNSVPKVNYYPEAPSPDKTPSRIPPKNITVPANPEESSPTVISSHVPESLADARSKAPKTGHKT